MYPSCNLTHGQIYLPNVYIEEMVTICFHVLIVLCCLFVCNNKKDLIVL